MFSLLCFCFWDLPVSHEPLKPAWIVFWRKSYCRNVRVYEGIVAVTLWGIAQTKEHKFFLKTVSCWNQLSDTTELFLWWLKIVTYFFFGRNSQIFCWTTFHSILQWSFFINSLLSYLSQFLFCPVEEKIHLWSFLASSKAYGFR